MKSQKQMKEKWKYIETSYVTKSQGKKIWRGDLKEKWP